MLVIIKSDFEIQTVAEKVKIIIPVPLDAENPKGKYTVGIMKYVPKDNTIVWTINQFVGQRQYSLRAHFGLSSVQSENEDLTRPIHVQFSIPFFTMSGLRVMYLKTLDRLGYTSSAWVKYVTTNANYEFRT
jgi:AP-1 complex subunit mu